MEDKRRAAYAICATLRGAGHRALLAGGCVRDMLLGAEPQDFDIATSAKPGEIAALFPNTASVGAAFGVQAVILPEGVFEVATFRRDGPYLDGRHPSTVEFLDERADAQRRDFTINALFFDPETGVVVDYVDGRRDLREGVIRAVGDPRLRFQEDHLRLLRAVRFAARFGYRIEEKTFEAIKAQAPSIVKTSAERIRDEILKILTEGQAKRGFELLDETGLLQQILPEVARMKGVEQPAEFHPEGDVFTHTLLMLGLLEKPSETLALGALLHDVGKPVTMTVTDRIRFNEHDREGARLAEDICRRLRMPVRTTERVAWLVGQHMRLAHAPQMRESKRKRFVREEGFQELLELCRLDCLASHENTDVIEWLEDYAAHLKPEELKPAPLLRGTDLIELGYAPGPIFKEILQAVEDAQLEGAITGKEEALAFVRERWKL